MGLVERDTEQAVLQAQWARARAGSGGLVLVMAESGGGRTALVNAARLRQDLRDRGVASIPARPRAATLTNAVGLTAREVEVLGLLAEGLSNAELAGRLYIPTKTADHHVSAILSKLRVSNRRQATRAGRKLGILGPS